MEQVTAMFSQLDARTDVRGRQFERLCQWCLEDAPEYRRRIPKVWLWSDWPGPRAPIRRSISSQRTATVDSTIQAKAYAERYAIKKADVDSFLRLRTAGRPAVGG
jgi:predicted helicase